MRRKRLIHHPIKTCQNLYSDPLTAAGLVSEDLGQDLDVDGGVVDDQDQRFGGGHGGEFTNEGRAIRVRRSSVCPAAE